VSFTRSSLPASRKGEYPVATMSRHFTLCVVAAAIVLGAGAEASAEIVYFASGRTMSIKAHREQGTHLVLVLVGGGEVVCDAAAVARIVPDELPAFEALPKEAVAAALASASAYDGLIEEAAARHGVLPQLVRAIIQVESAYCAEAKSRKGAIGLMQLMPATARRFAVADPYDPGANIEGGIKYLKSLLERFDVSLALAAYNAGEAAVQRFGGIPPYAETRNYVQAVMKLAGLASRP
jgi:hypothetical protein